METRRVNYYDSYVQGSTVRQLNYAQRIEREHEREQEIRRNRQAQRAQSRHAAAGWDFLSMVFLLAAISVVLYVCVSYIQLQHDIHTMGKKIASMENTIVHMKIENDAAYNQVDTAIDLAYVYDVAVNELGMVRPDKSQMKTYENIKSNVVRQYGELPEEKGSIIDQLIGK